MIASGASRYAAPPFFFAAILFVLLAPAYWTSVETPQGWHVARAYENLDLYERVYPFYNQAYAQLRTGNLPLWHPGQFNGTPFMGALQLALFQPLHAVFWLLPTERALAMHAFIGLALAGFFFVLFGRALGLRYLPALCGAVVYAFGGATAGVMSRPELLSTLAWTPILFWAFRELGREGRLHHAVAAGFALGLMLLSGAYALWLAIAPVAFAYALLRSPYPNKKPRFENAALVWHLGVGLLLAFSLSVAQWLPQLVWSLNLDDPWEAWGQSVIVGDWPSGLGALLGHMITPTPDKVPRIAYVGVLGVALLPLSFFLAGARKDGVFFAGVAVFCLGLALWSRSEGAPDALQVMVFPAHFALAVLAALGAEQLTRTERDLRHPYYWLAALAFVASVLALAYFATPEARGRLLPIAPFFLLLLLFRTKWMAAFFGAVLVFLIFTDLYAGNVNYYRHPYEDMAALRKQVQQVTQLAGEQARNERVLVLDTSLDTGLPNNLGMYSALLCANGRGIPLGAEQRQFWQALGLPHEGKMTDGTIPTGAALPNARLLDALSVRVVLAGQGPDSEAGAALLRQAGLRYDRQLEGVHLYINEDAVPRTFWTPIWHATPGIGGALSLLQGENFDLRRACTVQSGTLAYKALTDLMPQAESNADSVRWDRVVCRIVDSAPNRVELQVDTPSPGMTVLLDSFAPGWVARINGERVPVQKVNGMFRGVATPVGSHTVVFSYEPWVHWIALGISCLTCAILVLGALAHIALVRRLAPLD